MVDIKALKKFTNSLSVLYVEDELDIQKSMGNYLKKFFASVSLASDGVEGLALFEQNDYDIVLTDISMPKMNGSDMIARIREVDSEVPIVITTAHIDSNYLMDAIKSHVDGYIIKPFDYNLLNTELFKVSEKIQKFKENTTYKTHLKELLQEQTQQMQENYEKTIYSMVELIEERDTYTAGHSKRVAYYSTLVAKAMGYSEEEVTLLHQAAILHDVGKIETPDSVLLKPKKLNEIEFTLIKEHVTVGYKLLDNIPMFKPLSKIVYQHHEMYNGKGYPNGIKGEELDPLARVLMLCDTFDAMTTNRIYKGRKSTPEALAEIKSLSGKQFDPEVVKYALEALKDITIDENINQLPKTKLEEERFAYFYKDNLTQIYNQNYIDVVLASNVYKPEYQHMFLFFIHKFSKFNLDAGWEEGDRVLKEFAKILDTHFGDSLVFRIFGDDFSVLSKESIDAKGAIKVLSTLIEKNNLTFTTKEVDLTKTKIDKLSDLTFLRH